MLITFPHGTRGLLLYNPPASPSRDPPHWLHTARAVRWICMAYWRGPHTTIMSSRISFFEGSSWSIFNPTPTHQYGRDHSEHVPNPVPPSPRPFLRSVAIQPQTHSIGRKRRTGTRSQRTAAFEVEILDCKTKQQLCFLDKIEPNLTVNDIKLMFHKCYPQWYPARQSIRLDPKGRSLKDEEMLQDLPVGTTATLYFQDLGSQIGWTMVFLIEYTGPLFVYFLFYFRMPFFYGLAKAFTSSPHSVVHLACCCHSFHYIKRLIETIFVHRFSHGTMPLRSIVKNCFYYWGFAAWLAYYINHPLYTPPSYGKKQISLAMIMFLMCETGNFSIHVTLSNQRVDGSKLRRYPLPSQNPFTWLFFFVSCPNYTYEVGSWISFTVMTQCVPVGIFALIGFIQMTIWAKEKHHRYIKEFKDYPRIRTSIIPFLL
ncbi:very-long-chain enoyl-CoA reductase-like [Mantella aurantiaca]